MKKIYSFMLMATMLLIGTNVNAGNVAKIGNVEYATLDGATGAFAAAQSSADDAVTIQLIGADTLRLNDGITINTTKSITLDMNGRTIVANNSAGIDLFFNLTKGELIITSSTSACLLNYGGKKLIQVSGTHEIPNNGKYEETDQPYYSRLQIDENVMLKITNIGDGKKAKGIVVEKSTEKLFPAYTHLNEVFHPNYIFHGSSHGVVIDMYGDIEFTGHANAKGYGVQVTGNVRSVNEFLDVDKYATIYTYLSETQVAEGFGAVKIGDKVYYKFTLNNQAQYADASWDNYVPKINLYDKCHIVVPGTSTGMTAMYAGGYANWNIQCEAEGSSALVAKAGVFEVYNATLKSTATEYSPVEFATNENGVASGIDNKGTAVVLESNSSYPGQIQITFKGNNFVEALSGFAIEEAVTTPSYQSQETKLASISIQGGSFESKSAEENIGCIRVSTQALDQIDAGVVQVTIGGGSYAAGTENQQAETRSLIERLIGGDPSGSDHTMELTTPQTGSGKTLIISSEPIPDPAEASAEYFTLDDLKAAAAADPDRDVNLKSANPNELPLTLDEDLTLGSLYMNCDYALEIVVPDGFTLTVNRIVMNDNAKVTVEAGGKLVVVGDQGVYTKNENNLVIEAQEGKMGIFIFKPSIITNQHPSGTVELISKAFYKDNKYKWQRFGVPAYNGITRAEIKRDVPTAFVYWDNETGWTDLADDQKLLPFQGYSLTINQNLPNSVYKFECDALYGNINAPIEYVPDWNYFANSYTADIDILAFVTKLMTSDVEAAVHINTSSTDNSWSNVAYYDLLDDKAEITKLAPMQCFTTKHTADVAFKDTINYEKMVWNPAMGISNNAPARRNMMASDYTKAVIEIANAENVQKVTLRQGNQFSEEFDNGADVSAFKAGEVSMYANTEIGELVQIATDNLIGQTLTVESAKATSFKMTFKNLRGETLAIRDNFTGSVINMTEGAEYYFSVAPNTAEARFEIVEAAKMPTDVETLDAAPAKKGIYSLQGQYLGENFHVLPAGIYVVNGVKVVK